MNRNLCYSALILRSRSSGESNRDLWLLTAEAGILRATVFGGPKSKLRSYASPFHSGQAWIYQDPAKDNRKLGDFDVKSWRPGLRELYERAMAADAAAETVLASHGGGGNWSGALALTELALDTLAEADSESCARILLAFLWQWTGFLGIMPEIDQCSCCGKSIAANEAAFFLPAEGGMICEDCRANERPVNAVNAGPGCRKWLKAICSLPLSQLNRFTLDKKSLSEAKLLATAILAEAFGRRLASWDYWNF